MKMYRFDSTGGCARCDNMDGYYDEKPERPHPFCDCEIYADNLESDCYSLRIDPHGAVTVSDLDASSGSAIAEYEFEFTFDVICHHTQMEHTESYTYRRVEEIPEDDFDSMVAAWTALIDDLAVEFSAQFRMHAEIRAHELCECDDHDSSGSGGSLV
ncbi:MAG: hypothetical protein AAF402_00060 [Pseudomonadota bacterium]